MNEEQRQELFNQFLACEACRQIERYCEASGEPAVDVIAEAFHERLKQKEDKPINHGLNMSGLFIWEWTEKGHRYWQGVYSAR